MRCRSQARKLLSYATGSRSCKELNDGGSCRIEQGWSLHDSWWDSGRSPAYRSNFYAEGDITVVLEHEEVAMMASETWVGLQGDLLATC